MQYYQPTLVIRLATNKAQAPITSKTITMIVTNIFPFIMFTSKMIIPIYNYLRER
ncbi:hypothetical protein JCM16418A_21560 [Paenibacillus pini]